MVLKSLKLTLQLKLNDILPFEPSLGPKGAEPKKIAVVRSIHASNSHTKFGRISSNDLGGYSKTDRQQDVI